MPDAAYRAMQDKDVTLDLADGSKAEGKLVAVEPSDVVLVQPDGSVRAVPKGQVTALRMGIAPPATPDQPKPAPAKQAEPKPVAADEPSTKRGEPDHHHKLGLFTSHGVAYTGWRGWPIDGGHATYALDLGVGYNPTPRWGVYGMVGGMVGTRLGREYRGHYGHFALMGRRAWKYAAVMFGAGLGIAEQRGRGRVVEPGFALPFKVMGIVPLPKELFLGIGLAAELAFHRNQNFVGGIGLQVTFGRW